jgi:hypothetical protein
MSSRAQSNTTGTLSPCFVGSRRCSGIRLSSFVGWYSQELNP